MNKFPIGYYLKKVDNLLTQGINKIHSEFDITRIQWQILSLISQDNEANREKVIEALTEFADKEVLKDTISLLISRNLINENKFLTLTRKGKDLFNSCLEKQKAFRQKAMRNISEQEYMQIIRSLEKIIDNLK